MNIAKVIFSRTNNHVLRGCRHFLLSLLLVALPTIGQSAVTAGFTYTIGPVNGIVTITGYIGPGGVETIPASFGAGYLVVIGSGAFAGISSLTSVNIPGGIVAIEPGAFSFCSGLTNVTIGNGVLSIGDSAFSFCDSLTTVTIPQSVFDIGVQPFASCARLSSISVDPLNTSYSSENGVLFDQIQTLLIQWPAGKAGSYTIPNTVSQIGAGAFWGCTNMFSITIPNTVTNIGNSAFNECINLTSVSIPGSVAVIGPEAFSFCSGLTNVTIGNGVSSIGDYAFLACPSLAKLAFLGNAPRLEDGFVDGGAGAKVYYYYGTTGWGPTYGGLPTVMLGAPAPQVGAGSSGVKPGGFGFTLTGVVNQTIVVEASTNLASWQSIWTRTLSTVSTNFVDPDWVNHPHRFYRLRSY